MGICTNCNHYLVCHYYDKNAEECNHFQDKANFVEVVRCKDCKHWLYEYDDVGLCFTDVPDIDGVQRLACDFCSYGERKDNER